eukprot:360056-Chlamydomonas_euryale.AAC.13
MHAAHSVSAGHRVVRRVLRLATQPPRAKALEGTGAREQRAHDGRAAHEHKCEQADPHPVQPPAVACGLTGQTGGGGYVAGQW